jgi:TRAP transporter TAXI family solute receptor
MGIAVLLVLLFMLSPAFPAAAAGGVGKKAENPETWPAGLRLLSGPNGGQWYFLGDAIAEAFTKHLLPTVSRIGGGVANIASVGGKTADVGFTLNCFLGASASGEEEYKSIKLENTAVLADIYPQVMYFLVRKDFADAHGIKDLDGLVALKAPVNFASLHPGTASEFLLSMILKYGYGTDVEKLGSENGWNVVYGNYAEIADDIADGALDCFAYSAGVDVPLIHAIEGTTDVLILPMRKEVLSTLAGKFKTVVHVIEAGQYKNVSDPVETLGDYTCLITRADLPDDLVYGMANALWEDRAVITRTVADYGRLDQKTAVPDGLATHPGALRFWKELAEKD